MIRTWDSDRRQPEVVTLLALSAIALRGLGEPYVSALLSQAAGAVYSGISSRYSRIVEELDLVARDSAGSRTGRRGALLGRAVLRMVMVEQETARAA